MATELKIKLAFEGGQVAASQMDDVNARIKAMGVASQEARGHMAGLMGELALFGGALAGIAGVQKAIAAASDFTGLQARLTLLTGSAERSAQAMQTVVEIAQRQGTSLTAVGDSYVKIGTAMASLGVSSADTAKVVETVAASLRLGNASTAEAASTMRQFGQAMAKGKLNGDEFVSLMENASPLMDAVAASLGKTKGDLFAMAEAGQLTARVFGGAVLDSFASVTAKAATLPQTIGQAMENLTTAFAKAAGESKIVGATGAASMAAMGFAAEHAGMIIDGLAKAALVGLVRQVLVTADAYRVQVLATQQATAAQLAQLQGSVALAASAKADAAAKLAQMELSSAGIALARAETQAKLQGVQASIAQAQSQLAAAQAAGALSFALAVAREATVALTAAQAGQAVLVNELAFLGTKHAAVQATIATATAAQTAATLAQTAAQGALTSATSVGARALGFLGGPIGVITTLLGLGITAWTMWGDKAQAVPGQGNQAMDAVKDKLASAVAEQARLREGLERTPNNLFLKSALLEADKLVNKLNQAAGALAGVGAGRGTVNPKTVGQLAQEDSDNQDALDSFRLKQAKVPESYLKDMAELIRLNQVGKLVGNEYTAALKTQQDVLLKATTTHSEALTVAKQQAKQYADTLTGLAAKTAALVLEAQTGGHLTEVQKEQIAVNKLVTEGKIKAADATSAKTRAALEEMRVAERALAVSKSELDAATARARARSDERKGIEDFMRTQADASAQALKAVSAQVDGLQLEKDAADLVALTHVSLALAIEQVTLARLKEKQAQFTKGSEGWEVIQKEIDKRRELIGLIAGKETREAVAKSAKDAESAWAASNKQIGDGLYVALSEGGDSAIKKLLKDAREWFARLVLSPIIQPIAAFGASLLNPNAAQAGGSLLGSAVSTAGSGIADALGLGTVTAGLSQFGTAALASTQSLIGLTGTAAQASAAVTSGLAVQTGASTLAGTLGAAVPYVALAIAAYSLLSGSKFKSSESTGESGASFGADGSRVNNDISTYGPGFIGSAGADKIVTDLQATYMATAKGLGIGAVGTHFAFGGNTGAQGESPNFALVGGANGNYFRQGETSLNDDALKLAASRAVFTALQNSDLPKYLKGVFDGVDAGGSSQKQIDAVLTEAAAYKGLHDQMQMLPASFAQLKDMSFETAHALVTAAGDMGKFNANLSTYYDKFFTAAEKTATTTAAVGKVFADVGLVMPTLDTNARAAFRTLVEGQDLTTEAGRKAWTALMGVAGAFDAIVPAAADTTAATQAAADKAEAIAKEKQSWQDKLDVLTGKTTSREIELKTALANTTDAATQALIRQVFAQEDLNAATQTAADAAATLAGKLRDTLGSLADDAFGLTNDLLTAQGDDTAVAKRNREKYLAEHTAGLSAADALTVATQYDTNVGLRAQIKATIDAKNAATALATAQTQAADAASRAAEQLRAAWQGVADGLLNEVKRIRGELDGNGVQSLGQAKGAFDQAIARTVAGDDAAGKALPGLSQALLALEATNATSALALRRAQGRTAASLETTAAIVAARYGLAVPAGTASGYNLAANVPQLDPAPASPAVNLPAHGAAYSAGSSPAGPAAGEWAALLAEVQALRAAVSQGAEAAVDTQKLFKRLSRNGDAMLTRVATP